MPPFFRAVLAQGYLLIPQGTFLLLPFLLEPKWSNEPSKVVQNLPSEICLKSTRLRSCQGISTAGRGPDQVTRVQLFPFKGACSVGPLRPAIVPGLLFPGDIHEFPRRSHHQRTTAGPNPHPIRKEREKDGAPLQNYSRNLVDGRCNRNSKWNRTGVVRRSRDRLQGAGRCVERVCGQSAVRGICHVPGNVVERQVADRARHEKLANCNCFPRYPEGNAMPNFVWDLEQFEADMSLLCPAHGFRHLWDLKNCRSCKTGRDSHRGVGQLVKLVEIYEFRLSQLPPPDPCQ